MTAAVGSLTSRQRTILFLLFLSAWINYMDRGNLGVAAVPLSADLGIDKEQRGNLLAAFFWTYALLQPLAGWLVDRVNVARLYGLGYLTWSLATVISGFVNTYGQLFGVRLVLGAGESVAYPCYSRILATSFPESKRGFANTCIDVGTKAGPALGTLICGLLVARFGWRAMFLAIGIGSLLWLIPWFRVAPGRHDHTVEVPPAPPVSQLLKRRAAWATFIGLFCQNYAWYFLVTWLPSYLVEERKYTLTMMSIYGAIPFVATALSSLVAARMSDARIASGEAAVPVRCSFVMTGLFGCGILLPLALVGNPLLSMIFLILAFASLGLYTSNSWALTQSMSGPAVAGQWTGFQNAVGNMAGVLAPWLTGVLVQRTGQFAGAFFAASFFLLFGVLVYWFGLSRERREARATLTRASERHSSRPS